MEVEVLCEQVRAFLIERLNPEFVVLFGSFSRGLAHEKSDVDLAFYAPHLKISPLEVFQIAGELADVIGRSVDLINIEEASTVFKAQIFGYGLPIFIRDEEAFDRYRMSALSMYTVLNEDRKPILSKIYESGTIYGD